MNRVIFKKSLKRIQYFVMRHAFPVSLKQVRAKKDGKKVFANSIPKAGTNLLKELFHNIPSFIPQWTYQIDDSCPDIKRQLGAMLKGQVVTAHLTWSLELSQNLVDLGIRNFLIIRDLRDIAVSNTFYIMQKDRSHRLHSYFNSLNSFDACLSASITGIEGHLLSDNVRSKSIGEHANSFLPWIDDSTCLVVKFEDLVGLMGGGDDLKQKEVVGLILRHLNLFVDKDVSEKIAKATFSSGARTFRKGVIGDWQNYFTETHKNQFKEVAGDILIKMGYEKSLDW